MMKKVKDLTVEEFNKVFREGLPKEIEEFTSADAKTPIDFYNKLCVTKNFLESEVDVND